MFFVKITWSIRHAADELIRQVPILFMRRHSFLLLLGRVSFKCRVTLTVTALPTLYFDWCPVEPYVDNTLGMCGCQEIFVVDSAMASLCPPENLCSYCMYIETVFRKFSRQILRHYHNDYIDTLYVLILVLIACQSQFFDKHTIEFIKIISFYQRFRPELFAD